LEYAYTDAGTMVASGQWDGLPSDEAAGKIEAWMEAQDIGRRTTQYRMRDWLVSRQRYWGAPIPIIYCDRCGTVPAPEPDLPVLLPHTESWQPGKSARSPLANVPGFVQCQCPRCDGPGRRETDTMTGFACSSWYFLRFVSPQYSDGPFDPRALEWWGSPDIYVGGAEHATMHLLYARFWTKVLADAGIVPFREPFPVLRSQGVMHVPDPETGAARRMSKSAGNVVTPDSVAAAHGADALRIYLLFMAPFENDTVWEEEGITGSQRFLQRTWDLVHAVAETDPSSSRRGDDALRRTVHRTIQAVTSDLEVCKFNTAIATAMSCLNAMARHYRRQGVTVGLREAARTFVLLLAPLAPHLAEELWARLGERYSVHQQSWPAWDEALISTEVFTLVVQVNGRVRDRLEVPIGLDEETARRLSLESESVRPHLEGQRVTHIVYVPGRLINVVTA
jgi:leucyl-tRNA synthetase